MAEFSINTAGLKQSSARFDGQAAQLQSMAEEINSICNGLNRSFSGYSNVTTAIRIYGGEAKRNGVVLRQYGQAGTQIATAYEQNEHMIMGAGTAATALREAISALAFLDPPMMVFKGLSPKELDIVRAFLKEQDQGKLLLLLSGLGITGLYGDLQTLRSGAGGIRNLVDTIRQFLELSESSSLGEIVDALDNYPGKDVLKSLNYISDGTEVILAILDGDIDTAIKKGTDLTEDMLKEAFKSYGYANLEAEFYAKWIKNTVDNYVKAVTDDSFSGLPKVFDVFWRTAAIPVVDAGIEMGLDIASGTYDFVQTILGLEMENPFDIEVDDVYDQIYDLVETVTGKEGADLLKEKLSMGASVSELIDTGNEIKKEFINFLHGKRK